MYSAIVQFSQALVLVKETLVYARRDISENISVPLITHHLPVLRAGDGHTIVITVRFADQKDQETRVHTHPRGKCRK